MEPFPQYVIPSQPFRGRARNLEAWEGRNGEGHVNVFRFLALLGMTWLRQNDLLEEYLMLFLRFNHGDIG